MLSCLLACQVPVGTVSSVLHHRIISSWLQNTFIVLLPFTKFNQHSGRLCQVSACSIVSACNAVGLSAHFLAGRQVKLFVILHRSVQVKRQDLNSADLLWWSQVREAETTVVIYTQWTDPITVNPTNSYPIKSGFGAHCVTSSVGCVLPLQVNPVSFAHSPEEYLIAIGLQPTKPLSDLKAELHEAPPDQLQPAGYLEAAATASQVMDNATHPSFGTEGSQAQHTSSSGLQGQGQFQDPTRSLQEQSHGQPQAQRWLTLQQSSHDQTAGMKPEPTLRPVSDVSTGSKQKLHQQSQEASPRALGRLQSPNVPWASQAKVVPLSSLHQQPGPSQQGFAGRAITVGMPSMPVGSTTGIVGRSWPGQPQYGNQPATSTSRAGAAGSGPAEGRGTKRAGGGGESKGKKRQRHGDREKSVDGDGSGRAQR